MILEKIKETAAFLQKKAKTVPEIAIVLGSGLGGLAEKIDPEIKIPYGEIPHFPVSTVEGHKGQLILGKFAGKNIIAMQGRFHYYEGYSMQEVTFPIRVMYLLGAKTLIVSNAAGGMNPSFNQGDLMLITDHINNFPESPLRGKNLDDFGTRFPDMSRVYSPDYIQIIEKSAEKHGIPLQKGVYIGSSGPCLETPAEYRYLRLMGADATGMSTVPEAIVAHHQGMKIAGLSVITNVSKTAEEGEKLTTHEEVQDVAGKAERNMTLLIQDLLQEI